MQQNTVQNVSVDWGRAEVEAFQDWTRGKEAGLVDRVRYLVDPPLPREHLGHSP